MDVSSSSNLDVQRVESPGDARFAALVAIYRAAHPSSERKPDAELEQMVRSPEYRFLVVTLDGEVVGFAISVYFERSAAWLLEYMAVEAKQRSGGIGAFLFTRLVGMREMQGKFLLMEVDSEKLPSDDREDRVRRKRFYRRMGCREIEGLDYIMPPLCDSLPPAMDIMVYRADLPGGIKKAQLLTWLEDMYVHVYCRRPDDSRIGAMTRGLPENLRLI